MVKKNEPVRKWEPREMRLVSEYIAKVYPKYPSFTRVRLGAIHPGLLSEKLAEEEKRMLTVWKRWADAVVITPRQLILIEASILPDPGDISKLLLYEHLLRFTPEFEKYKHFTIVKELVMSIEDPLISSIARKANIKVVLYTPDWIADYIRSLALRKQRAPLTFPKV